MTATTALSARSTIAGVLSRHGIAADERELARALEAALGRYVSSPGSAPLSEQQRSVLREGGLDLDADHYRAQATRTAAEFTALVATALSVAETAARLGVDDSRIRHRIKAGELWALPLSGGRRLLPALQFAPGGGLVPGLPEVLRALPEGLHPLETAGFLTTRRDDLRLRGRDQSPIEWLLHGGDPAAAVGTASGVRDRLR